MPPSWLQVILVMMPLDNLIAVAIFLRKWQPQVGIMMVGAGSLSSLAVRR